MSEIPIKSSYRYYTQISCLKCSAKYWTNLRHSIKATTCKKCGSTRTIRTGWRLKKED